MDRLRAGRHLLRRLGNCDLQGMLASEHLASLHRPARGCFKSPSHIFVSDVMRRDSRFHGNDGIGIRRLPHKSGENRNPLDRDSSGLNVMKHALPTALASEGLQVFRYDNVQVSKEIE